MCRSPVPRHEQVPGEPSVRLGASVELGAPCACTSPPGRSRLRRPGPSRTPLTQVGRAGATTAASDSISESVTDASVSEFEASTLESWTSQHGNTQTWQPCSRLDHRPPPHGRTRSLRPAVESAHPVGASRGSAWIPPLAEAVRRHVLQCDAAAPDRTAGCPGDSPTTGQPLRAHPAGTGGAPRPEPLARWAERWAATIDPQGADPTDDQSASRVSHPDTVDDGTPERDSAD